LGSCCNCYTLILHTYPKDEKKYIIVPEKQQIIGLDDVENEEEYNQCDEVPFFVDTKRINNVETKIFYNEII
jgi:hypothetical protein